MEGPTLGGQGLLLCLPPTLVPEQATDAGFASSPAFPDRRAGRFLSSDTRWTHRIRVQPGLVPRYPSSSTYRPVLSDAPRGRRTPALHCRFAEVDGVPTSSRAYPNPAGTWRFVALHPGRCGRLDAPDVALDLAGCSPGAPAPVGRHWYQRYHHIAFDGVGVMLLSRRWRHYDAAINGSRPGRRRPRLRGPDRGQRF